MKKGANKHRERVLCTLIITSLFLVLASQVTGGQTPPARRTSVEDITDNQEKIKEKMSAITIAMTEMADKTESQIKGMERSIILYLFALFFFYQASSALWRRVIKYRHWQKHVTTKSDLETKMTKSLLKQNELLTENNQLLTKLKDTFSSMVAKPEEPKPEAVALAMATATKITDMTVTKKTEDEGKKKPIEKAKKHIPLFLKAFVLIGILALTSTIAHYTVFTENILYTAILSGVLMMLAFWGFIALWFLQWRKNKQKKPTKLEKPEKREDKPVETDIKKEEKKQVEPKKEDKTDKVDEYEKKEEKKPDPFVKDLENRINDALQEQDEMEKAIKAEPELVTEEKPPKPSQKLGFLERIGLIKKKKGKEDKTAKTMEELDELYDVAEQLTGIQQPQPIMPQQQIPGQIPIINMDPQVLRKLADRLEETTTQPSRLGGAEVVEEAQVVEQEPDEGPPEKVGLEEAREQLKERNFGKVNSMMKESGYKYDPKTKTFVRRD